MRANIHSEGIRCQPARFFHAGDSTGQRWCAQHPAALTDARSACMCFIEWNYTVWYSSRNSAVSAVVDHGYPRAQSLPAAGWKHFAGNALVQNCAFHITIKGWYWIRAVPVVPAAVHGQSLYCQLIGINLVAAVCCSCNCLCMRSRHKLSSASSSCSLYAVGSCILHD